LSADRKSGEKAPDRQQEKKQTVTRKGYHQPKKHGYQGCTKEFERHNILLKN
jgi:hypothetical protein